MSATDERELLGVLYRYGEAIDTRDGDGFADLFTEQGVLETRYPAAQAVRSSSTSGREALRAFAGRSRSNGKHCVFDPRIVWVSESAAEVESVWIVLQSGPEPTVNASGTYRDEFSRGADRRWRIARRTTLVEFRRES